MTEKVKYKVQDGVAYVTVNNQQKMNILDLDVYNRLISAFESIEEDGQVRVAILTEKVEMRVAAVLKKKEEQGGYITDIAYFRPI